MEASCQRGMSSVLESSGNALGSGRGSGAFPSTNSSNTAHDVHSKVSAAVKQMQGALQAELHEDQLQLFRRLGEGGFGTVYHGV